MENTSIQITSKAFVVGIISKMLILMIIGTRFRRPSEEEAKHITNFLNAGKPIIGIRTSTHAFTGSGSFGDKYLIWAVWSAGYGRRLGKSPW